MFTFWSTFFPFLCRVHGCSYIYDHWVSPLKFEKKRFGWNGFLCLVSYEKHVSGSWQADGSWFKPKTNVGRCAALPRLPWARYQTSKCSDGTTSSLKLREIKMIFLLALRRRELFCVLLCKPQVPFHRSSWQISDFYSWRINANIDAAAALKNMSLTLNVSFFLNFFFFIVTGAAFGAERQQQKWGIGLSLSSFVIRFEVLKIFCFQEV